MIPNNSETAKVCALALSPYNVCLSIVVALYVHQVVSLGLIVNRSVL